MKYAIEIEKLSKIYKSGVCALKNVSLKVQSGDFYALLGQNGAGKSTIIGIISSLISRSGGKIKIFGLSMDKDVMSVRRKLGLVPQEFNFNPFDTVKQIIINQAGYYGINKKRAIKRAKKYLMKFDLWNKKEEFGRLLSSGMKRRLMVVRALIHKPKLLILDEPTAGVDVELRRFIWNFLTDLNKKGITIVLTTHYLEEAEILCRNVGIIHCGKLIENTSIKNLLKKLKFETFILDVADTNILPKIKGYNYKIIDNTTIEVEVSREQGMNVLFKQLDIQGIKVLSMRNKTNRLEELFFSSLLNNNAGKFNA